MKIFHAVEYDTETGLWALADTDSFYPDGNVWEEDGGEWMTPLAAESVGNDDIVAQAIGAHNTLFYILPIVPEVR
jgi:hypothetical protein